MPGFALNFALAAINMNKCVKLIIGFIVLFYSLANSNPSDSIISSWEVCVSYASSFYQRETRGLSLNAGILKKRSYYGIKASGTYASGDKSGPGGQKIFGGAFSYQYELIDLSKIAIFAPGFVAGYWYQEEWTLNDSHQDRLIIGPLIRAALGFRHLFLSSTFSLLIGTNLTTQFEVGLLYRN